MIVGWGVHAIGVAAGWWRTASISSTPFATGLVRIRSKRAATRAWLVGVLTGLLPCGWLWAFVVSAAGTASAFDGAIVMGVFWLGTVPAMTGVLALGGPLIARLRARLPIVTACVLVVLGVVTLATRWPDTGSNGVARPSCHEVMK